MFEFVTTNWVAILAAVSGVIHAAQLITKLTPSTKDDEFVAKVEAALSVIGK
ncbi:hypothetical protein ACXHXM_34065